MINESQQIIMYMRNLEEGAKVTWLHDVTAPEFVRNRKTSHETSKLTHHLFEVKFLEFTEANDAIRDGDEISV